jgi:ferredoxin
MRIEVDRKLCVGLAECVAEAPTVFELDSFGKAVLLDPVSVDDERILAAAKSCPVNAITLYDDNGKQIYP